ncbi:hypothetical protein X757_15525 [Mesorhizobium sp. LSHC414A00]|nr:hypothetical protein X757_15525 [Mesorhizobium sp. LSHC414A00]ESY32746.1 hypothetical protein X749_03590 [Mesorhizobium sp. LNJC391B00]
MIPKIDLRFSKRIRRKSKFYSVLCASIGRVAL